MATGFKNLRRGIAIGATLPLIGLAGILYAPSVLAFPHRAQIGDVTVYSVEPIGPEMAGILARADARVATSPLAAPLGKRAIYLTDGGWRWHVLAIPTSSGAFALTRPYFRNIVVNRSASARDEVRNTAVIGNRRTLSGTIAHETTHLLINRHYGLIGARQLTGRMVEGYCDHVAQESSLSSAEAAALRKSGSAAPALRYFDAREYVAQRLAAGVGVDQLLHE